MSRRLGAALGWTALALVVVFAVLAVWAAGRDSAVGEHERSPDDPSPAGAMAVAEVLTELEDRLGIVIEDDEVDGEMLETFGALVTFAAGKALV